MVQARDGKVHITYTWKREKIRHAIVAGKSATEIKEIARRKGMKTLREDGLYKALQGITTLEEVLARTIE